MVSLLPNWKIDKENGYFVLYTSDDFSSYSENFAISKNKSKLLKLMHTPKFAQIRKIILNKHSKGIDVVYDIDTNSLSTAIECNID